VSPKPPVVAMDFGSGSLSSMDAVNENQQDGAWATS
jgi:hypothetical protein